MTRHAAVLGWPIGHSASPAIHDAAFRATGVDAVMRARAVPPDELLATVAALAGDGCLGASVTVPHKQAVMAACTSLAAPAARIGAVNCLQFVAAAATGTTAVIGHNTDGVGFAAALAAAGLARPAVAVVLGAGGAARAVVDALLGLGSQVTVVARRPEAADWLPAPAVVRAWTPAVLAEVVATAAVLIDATSAGLDAAADRQLAATVPVTQTPPGCLVTSLIYHHATALLELADHAGRPTLDGRGMLVHQAAAAFTLWTGLPAPLAVMTAALDAELTRRARGA